MSPETHELVMEILGEALELSPNQRGAFLDKACKEQPGVRAEVERLLQIEADAPRALPTDHGAHALAEAVRPPKQVGPYKIIRTLGEGGMGVVYLAEQEHPVRRTVALKLIRPGMDSRHVVSRFASERQALAMMNHPNLAHVYDAGTSETGRPYFVMEYVDGLPLTFYCDEHRLTTRQRLELFIDVCQAVQHAHTKGIIHRDLKPSNVLVVAPGNSQKPLVKVIDFGIAKAVRPDGSSEHLTLLTEAGLLMGTPEYISPEQAEGSIDVDTRSDVYSLGVMLYQLLTGSLPLDRRSLKDVSYHEVLRMIREVEPKRPSTRFGGAETEQSQSVASLRRCDTNVLRKQLRGDLDWIILKALEKDRERRYGSAAELAADIARHLRDEPVTAGPPTTTYRVGKFVRRHRAAVVASALLGAALLGAALIGGVIGTGWQAIRARRAERAAVEQQRIAQQQHKIAQEQHRIAQRRFDDVRTLAGSFMFEIDEAMTMQGPTKARELMVRTALRYLDSLAGESPDSDLQRELMQGYLQVGQVQFYPGLPHLGDPAGALTSYTKALGIAQARHGATPDDPQAMKEMVTVLTHLAEAQAELGKSENALRSFESAMKLCESIAAAEADPTLVRRNIGVLMHKMQAVYRRTGDSERALDMAEKALALREELLAGHPNNRTLRRDVFASHETLAALKQNLGLPAEALAHCKHAIEYAQAVAKAQPDNPLAQRDASNQTQRLAEVYVQLGRPGAAMPPIEQGLAEHRRIVEADQSNYESKRDVANSWGVRAEALLALGRSTDALESFQTCLNLRSELAQTNPSDETVARGIAKAHLGIARCRRELGQLEQALESAQRALQSHEARLAANPANDAIRYSLCSVHAALGAILLDMGRATESVSELHRAVNEFPSLSDTSAKAPAQRRGLAAFLIALGEAQAAAAQVDQSIGAFESAITLCEDVLAVSPQDEWVAVQVAVARVALARAQTARGDLDSAQRTLEPALKSASQLAKIEGCGVDARLAEWMSQVALAELRRAQNKPDEAQAARDRAIELERQLLAIDPANARYRAMLRKHEAFLR